MKKMILWILTISAALSKWLIFPETLIPYYVLNPFKRIKPMGIPIISAFLSSSTMRDSLSYQLKISRRTSLNQRSINKNTLTINKTSWITKPTLNYSIIFTTIIPTIMRTTTTIFIVIITPAILTKIVWFSMKMKMTSTESLFNQRLQQQTMVPLYR